MVSVLTLALLAVAALPVAVQTSKLPGRIQPRKVVISPGNPRLSQNSSTGKCSIPLVNVFAGARQPAHWGMPVIRPGEIGRMPIVQPPAPPCAVWPPK